MKRIVTFILAFALAFGTIAMPATTSIDCTAKSKATTKSTKKSKTSKKTTKITWKVVKKGKSSCKHQYSNTGKWTKPGGWYKRYKQCWKCKRELCESAYHK